MQTDTVGAFDLAKLLLTSGYFTVPPGTLSLDGRVVDIDCTLLESHRKFGLKTPAAKIDASRYDAMLTVLEFLAGRQADLTHLYIPSDDVADEYFRVNAAHVFRINKHIARISDSGNLSVPPFDEYCLFGIAGSEENERRLLARIDSHPDFWWGEGELLGETFRSIGVKCLLATYDDHAVRWRFFREY